MSETRTATAQRLRRAVAEEVRVAMARRRCTGARLAAMIGRSESYVSRRLLGAVSWDLDDLAAIADALYLDPAELLPGRAPAGARRRVTAGLVGKRVVPGGPRRPVRLRGGSPLGQPAGSTRPVTPLSM